MMRLACVSMPRWPNFLVQCNKLPSLQNLADIHVPCSTIHTEVLVVNRCEFCLPCGACITVGHRLGMHLWHAKGAGKHLVCQGVPQTMPPWLVL
jgi:hypothetical protein